LPTIERLVDPANVDWYNTKAPLMWAMARYFCFYLESLGRPKNAMTDVYRTLRDANTADRAKTSTLAVLENTTNMTASALDLDFRRFVQSRNVSQIDSKWNYLRLDVEQYIRNFDQTGSTTIEDPRVPRQTPVSRAPTVLTPGPAAPALARAPSLPDVRAEDRPQYQGQHGAVAPSIPSFSILVEGTGSSPIPAQSPVPPAPASTPPAPLSANRPLSAAIQGPLPPRAPDAFPPGGASVAPPTSPNPQEMPPYQPSSATATPPLPVGPTLFQPPTNSATGPVPAPPSYPPPPQLPPPQQPVYYPQPQPVYYPPPPQALFQLSANRADLGLKLKMGQLQAFIIAAGQELQQTKMDLSKAQLGLDSNYKELQELLSEWKSKRTSLENKLTTGELERLLGTVEDERTDALEVARDRLFHDYKSPIDLIQRELDGSILRVRTLKKMIHSIQSEMEDAEFLKDCKKSLERLGDAKPGAPRPPD
jgi:hypothetical protein